MQCLDTLRNIDGYYLRNAAISLSEGIVRASYNCDGTYIVRADYFAEFVRLNTPEVFPNPPISDGQFEHRDRLLLGLCGRSITAV